MTARVFHADLWGKRDDKYAQFLEHTIEDTQWTALDPSKPFYLFPPNASGLLDIKAWRKTWTAKQWKTQLRRPDDDAADTHIRRSTHAGRPLATDRFLSKLERALGRRLRPLPVGRPPKNQKAKKPSRKKKNR